MNKIAISKRLKTEWAELENLNELSVHNAYYSIVELRDEGVVPKSILNEAKSIMMATSEPESTKLVDIVEMSPDVTLNTLVNQKLIEIGMEQAEIDEVLPSVKKMNCYSPLQAQWDVVLSESRIKTFSNVIAAIVSDTLCYQPRKQAVMLEPMLVIEDTDYE